MTAENEFGFEAVASAVEAAEEFAPPASPNPTDPRAENKGQTLSDNAPTNDGSQAGRRAGEGGRGRPYIGGGEGDARGNDGDGVLDYCARQPENDTGNAYRMLAWHGANFFNVRQVGWHRWTGTHYEVEDGEEYINRYAQATAAAIAEEADFLGTTEDEAEKIALGRLAEAVPQKDRTPEQEKAVTLARVLTLAISGRKRGRRKYAVSSGNTQRIKGMITQALPWRTLPPTRMDPDRSALNVLNGTLRFEVQKEGGKRWVERSCSPHNRADLFTKVMPATYQEEAECPRWLDFLELTQPDPEMRAFLQCFAGAALLGARGKPVILFHYGAGANGKSTFAEALRRLFGSYAQALNAEAFSGVGQKRGDQATPELAQLPGKRLVIVSELAENEPVKEALLKALSGGEAVQARHLHGRFFDFVPVFRAMMSGNAMPRITGTDFGIWRRLKIVPWEVTLPEPSQREMEVVMREFEIERAGILNWLMDGLERFLLEGLVIPEKVNELTETYKAEVDIVGSFIDACLIPCELNPDDANDGIQAGPLFEIFQLWCKENGKTRMTNTKFGREMRAKGMTKISKHGRNRYVGVRLSPDAPRVSDALWDSGGQWEPETGR